jgi:hypothetical protein
MMHDLKTPFRCSKFSYEHEKEILRKLSRIWARALLVRQPWSLPSQSFCISVSSMFFPSFILSQLVTAYLYPILLLTYFPFNFYVQNLLWDCHFIHSWNIFIPSYSLIVSLLCNVFIIKLSVKFHFSFSGPWESELSVSVEVHVSTYVRGKVSPGPQDITASPCGELIMKWVKWVGAHSARNDWFYSNPFGNKCWWATRSVLCSPTLVLPGRYVPFPSHYNSRVLCTEHQDDIVSRGVVKWRNDHYMYCHGVTSNTNHQRVTSNTNHQTP